MGNGLTKQNRNSRKPGPRFVTRSGADRLAAVNASGSGLQQGDVIPRAQQEVVADPSQALRRMQIQTALKHPFASVLVRRDGKPTWIPVAVPER